MAIITKPKTFTAGTPAVAADVNSDFDTIYNDYNGGITKANISAVAGIEDTKLATISTAGKVSGAALTLLPNIPSGAGVIPLANVPIGITGATKNLKIVRTNVTTVTVTADEIILNNGSRITSVSFACAITTAGVGGLDTGSEAKNTIYYIYALSASTGILSASASAPTGQTVYALIGVVGNNGNGATGDFIDFVQEGSKYIFKAGASMGGTSNTSNVFTAIDLTPADMDTNPGFVPSALSTIAFGTVRHESTANIGLSNISTETVGNSTTNQIYLGGAFTANLFWRFHILTADTLYYATDGTNANVYLAGFEINKLPLG